MSNGFAMAVAALVVGGPRTAGGAIDERRQAGFASCSASLRPFRVTTLIDRARSAAAPIRTGSARLIGGPWATGVTSRRSVPRRLW